LDTNVLVSVLLGPERVPARAFEALRARGATFVYDARIRDEYRDVIARPKFRVPEVRREALLEAVFSRGELLSRVEPYLGELPDPDDRAFVEVALAGRAEAIVTGNVKDFPEGLGFEVLPPATVLARLELA
jgi:putative PIN family toxin of toxin-antitoxin system